MTEENEPKRISRRTVAKGLAWAIPAVPLVVAAPAYAQSPQCLSVTLTGDSCKWPGSGNQWSYRFTLCFKNSCGGTYTVWVDSLRNNSGKPFTRCTDIGPFCTNPLPTPGEIVIPPTPPGSDGTCYGPCVYSSTSSANFVEVWGSLSGPISDTNPAVKLLTTPAPTVPCLGDSPCFPTTP